MRLSQFHLHTLKETPADADVISQKLMLRTGMIRRIAAGLYSWMPLGLRSMRKVEAIVREEMNRAGGIELLMPSAQPSELWQESGRWDEFGPELLRFQDRHGRDFCAGPTHEEVVTDIARNEVRSYKQLPLNFYQIQTKFRDERRPRYGVMRSREFLMKDAYSFDSSADGMGETYQKMYDAYCRIFDRIGLQYRAVLADSGAIGGNASMEFHVLADSGEDQIVYSTSGQYAANLEKAETLALDIQPVAPQQDMRLVDTPNTKTIAALVEGFDLPIKKSIKTLIVHANENTDANLVALIVRGDHELNEVKAEKLALVKAPLQMAEEAEIRAAIGAGPGSLGPVNLSIPLIIDRDVAALSDFSAGANIDDKHYFGVNWERDLPTPEIADIRNAQIGDLSPDGDGTLDIMQGIEVGHIFQLGQKYSEAMGCNVLNEQGKSIPLHMGCYGIGVTRVVAAAIEQNYDDKGMIWPDSIAPFEVALAPIGLHKSEDLREAAEKLYKELQQAGLDVVFDDRGLRPGAMFADLELIGIPHRIVISDKLLEKGEVEYKGRRDENSTILSRETIVEAIKHKIAG